MIYLVWKQERNNLPVLPCILFVFDYGSRQEKIYGNFSAIMVMVELLKISWTEKFHVVKDPSTVRIL